MLRRAHHLRLFAFDQWANLRVLEALAPVADRTPESVTLLAHVAGAKAVWLARIQGGAPTLPVWPALGLEETRAALGALHEAWRSLLADLDDEGFARRVTYSNTQGQHFTSVLEDIVTHLPVHGQHHRGQVLAAIRAAGGTPPSIDFIAASRMGAL